MICPLCSETVREGADICDYCGSYIKGNSSAKSSEPVSTLTNAQNQQTPSGPQSFTQPNTQQSQAAMQPTMQPAMQQLSQPMMQPTMQQPTQPIQQMQQAPPQYGNQGSWEPAVYQQQQDPQQWANNQATGGYPPQPQTIAPQPPHIASQSSAPGHSAAAAPKKSNSKFIALAASLVVLLLAGGVFAYFYFSGSGDNNASGHVAEDVQLTRARWIEMLVAADTPEALVSAAENDIFEEIFPDVDESTQGYVAINLAAGFGWLDVELDEGSFEPAAAATRDFVAGTALLALGYVFIDDEVEIADIDDEDEDERYFVELAVLAGVLDLDDRNRANPYGRAEPEYAQSVARLVKERRDSFVRPDDFENVITLADATLDLSLGYQTGEIRPLDEDEYNFETTPAIASQLAEGSVFVVSPTDDIVFDGIARKVTGITHDDGMARISTEMPEFEEVFDELSIWEELDLSGLLAAADYDDDDLAAGLSSYGDASMMPLSAAAGRLSEDSGGGGGGGGGSKHPFYIRIDVGFANFHIDYKKGVRDYTVRFETNIRVNLGIDFNAKKPFFKVDEFAAIHIPTTIPGASVKISLPYDISLEGDGTISQTHTIKLKFAVDMRSYVIPSGIPERGFDRSVGNLQAKGSLKGTVKGGIGFSAMFLGFDFVHVQFMMGVEAAVSLRQAAEGFCADFTIGLFAEAKMQYLKGLTEGLKELHKILDKAAENWNLGRVGGAVYKIAARFASNTLVKNLSNWLKSMEKSLTAGPATYEFMRYRFHWEGDTPLDIFYPERGYYPAVHDARGKPMAFCTLEADIRLSSPGVLNLQKNPSEAAVIDIDYFRRGNYVRAVYEGNYTLRALATEILTTSGNVLNGIKEGGGVVETRLLVMRDLIEYEKLLEVGYEGWDILGTRDHAAYERAIALAGETVITIRTETFGVPVIDEEEEETPPPSPPTPPPPTPDAPTLSPSTPDEPPMGEHPVLLDVWFEQRPHRDVPDVLVWNAVMTIRNDAPFPVDRIIIRGREAGWGELSYGATGPGSFADIISIESGATVTVAVEEYGGIANTQRAMAQTGFAVEAYWREGDDHGSVRHVPQSQWHWCEVPQP